MSSTRIKLSLIFLAVLYVFFAQQIGIQHEQGEGEPVVLHGIKYEYPLDTIPVHFVWIHPNLATTHNSKWDAALFKAKQVAKEWMTLLPHGKYKLMFWTEQEILPEFAHLVPVLSKLSAPAWISDVLR